MKGEVWGRVGFESGFMGWVVGVKGEVWGRVGFESGVHGMGRG